MALTRRAAEVVLAAGVLTLLAGGVAQAAPSYHWCPGQPWDQSWGSIYDWDWNRCHDWQRGPGQGDRLGYGPWGVPPVWAPEQPPPPPWAPGAQVMWNMTARAWGIWNNSTWTTI